MMSCAHVHGAQGLNRKSHDVLVYLSVLMSEKKLVLPEKMKAPTTRTEKCEVNMRVRYSPDLDLFT